MHLAVVQLISYIPFGNELPSETDISYGTWVLAFGNIRSRAAQPDFKLRKYIVSNLELLED